MKTTRLKIKLIFLSLLFAFVAKSQTYTVTTKDSSLWYCGNEGNIYDFMQANGLLDSLQAFNDSLNARIGNGDVPLSNTYVIPVVFHVLNSGSTSAVTYQQAQWQIAAMNAAFSNQLQAFCGTSAGTNAVNTNIQFALACNAVYSDGTSGSWTDPLPNCKNSPP